MESLGRKLILFNEIMMQYFYFIILGDNDFKKRAPDAFPKRLEPVTRVFI